MTKKGVPWLWGEEQLMALWVVKERLTSNIAMPDFDSKKETELIVDASPVGLGAILFQKDKGEKHVIAYASSVLSDVAR